MRIVHVTDYFQPQAGYQEYFLARAHRELGHDVTVLTSDRYMLFPDYARTWEPVLGARQRAPGQAEELGVVVRRLPVWLELASRTFVLLRGLAAALRELAPELVMGHDLLSPTTFALARLQPRLGYRLVMDNHACDFNTRLDDSLAKRTYMGWYGACVAPLVRARATVLAIGRGEREMACRVLALPEARVPLFPLGADAARFRPDGDARARTRARLGLAEADRVIVHAGKLTAEKDVVELARAFARVAARHPEARLLLVGGGDPAYLRRVRAEVPPGRLIEHPTVPNAELPALFAAADVACWPGNFSQVIVEGLASALPVVLPSEFCAGYPSADLLARENGLAFPRGDVDALAAALARLVADPAAARAMGVRSRELVLQQLTWEALAQRLLEL